MRRLLGAAVVVAAASILFSPTAQADKQPTGGEGCVATSQPVPVVAKGTQLVYPKTCTYTATRAGGYVANGTWEITIKRGKAVIPLSSKGYNNSCTTAIKPKDVVTVKAVNGGAAVGNPFPPQTPSTNTTNADHRACAKK